jgi:hypothetical protein
MKELLVLILPFLVLAVLVEAFHPTTTIVSSTSRNHNYNHMYVLFMGKEWDRLGLSQEESEEIGKKEMWYILNCVAGGEKECLLYK